MYWSIYDTFVLATGTVIAAIGLLPMAGVRAKTRASALAGGAGVIALAFLLGNLPAFRYPSFVMVAPFVALLALGAVAADARKRSREGDHPLPFDETVVSTLDPTTSGAPLPEMAPSTELVRGEPAPEQPPANEVDQVTPSDDQERRRAWIAVHDPETSADELTAILAAFPEFGSRAIEHPNAHAELKSWIRQYVLGGEDGEA